MLKTWDIFDTLVARKCIYPKGIFQLIEEKCNLNGFVNARLKSEMIVSKENPVNYTIEDIYNKMCNISNLTEDDTKKLMKLECDIEIEQAIPIMENLSQVKAGDCLISDMYLPKNVIRNILKKIGLCVPVSLIVTSNGKSTGDIYKQFKRENIFLSHVGDNHYSDIKIPKTLGFEANISAIPILTNYEKELIEKDKEFIEYLRELRLKNPYEDAVRKIYWKLFIINVGILMIFVKEIHALQKRKGYDYIGFMGRDAYYLEKIYQKYIKQEAIENVETEYLYYSRALLANSPQDMREYIEHKIEGKKALLIDLRGSGAHLVKASENLTCVADLLICLWLGEEEAIKLYNQKNVKFYSYLDSEAIKEENKFYLYNQSKFKSSLDWDGTLEVVNRAPHNSPIRMKIVNIGNEKITNVTFSGYNDTDYLDVFEKCIDVVMDSYMHLPKIDESLEELAVPLLNLFYANKAHIFQEKHMICEMSGVIAFGQNR